MNKKILFSIVLCLGLILPTANFGSETSQTWYGKIASYFTEYMPQWQKYALYAALIGALGYGLYKTKEKQKQFAEGPLSKQIAEVTYHMKTVDQENIFSLNNVQNFKQFFSHIDAGWGNWKRSEMKENIKLEEEKNIRFYIFAHYIYPILKQLDLQNLQQFDKQQSYDYWINFLDQMSNKHEQRDPWEDLAELSAFLGQYKDSLSDPKEITMAEILYNSINSAADQAF